MEFLVLGSIEVRSAGEQVPVGGVKQRSILALLITNRGRPVSTDRIVLDIYGEDAAGGARRSVQSIVSMLRHELTDAIVGTSDGYVLDVPRDAIDAFRFQDAVATGLRLVDTQPEQASALLGEALSLWRGDPYADVDGLPVFEPDTVRLNELHSVAIEARIEADLRCGAHREVVPELEALVAESPLREHLWALLMLALYRWGRQADALRAYQQLASALGEQLGIEPSTELRELENRILLQDSELDLVPAIPHNLPAQLTSFIGRELELTDLGSVLTEAPLVTLTGPGGSGKTRLAIEFARTVLSDYPDGVWFVDLRNTTNPDDVPTLLASTLQVVVTGDQPVTDQLVETLSPRRMLLIVDNCEHILDGTAPLVERLLRKGGKLRILATSREPLGVPGESATSLHALATPVSSDLNDLTASEAAILFADRAGAAWPEFSLDDAAEPVFDICLALEGLPLAVELAAARLRTLSPEELADHINDQLGTLKTSQRAGDLRHATIEATIKWSWNLLTNTEQELLSRLSVFRGTWSLDAAEAICGHDPINPTQVLDLTESLTSKSLIVVDKVAKGKSRYRLLEPIRQYAARALNEPAIEQLQDRLVDYWSSRLRRAHGPVTRFTWRYHEQAKGLEPDRANLTLAVERALASGRYEEAMVIYANSLGYLLMLQGSAYAPTRKWMVAPLEHPNEVQPEVLLLALFVACTVASHAFRHEELLQYAELGIENSRTPEERQWFEIGTAVAMNRLGRHDGATRIFNHVFAEADNPGMRASALVGRAVYETPRPAWKSMQQAMALSPIDSLVWWDEGVAALYIGEAAYDAGHYEIAEKMAARSLSFGRRCGWQVIQGHAAALLAVLQALAGRLDEAATTIAEAVRVTRHILGPNIATPLVLRTAAGIARLRGDMEPARSYAADARQEAERSGLANWQIFATHHAALIARDEQDLEQARALLDHAVTEVTGSSLKRQVLRGYLMPLLWTTQASIALRMRDSERASTALSFVFTEYPGLAHEDELEAVDLMGIAFAQRGNAERAARLFGAVDAERERTGLVIPPPDAPLREAAVLQARKLLADGWEAIVETGRRMTLQEAVKLASQNPVSH